MNDYGRNKLLAELEDDLTDRICRTGDYADIPGFEGTYASLDDLSC